MKEVTPDWPTPNRMFDPLRAHELYRNYVDTMVYAEQCGFDRGRASMLARYGAEDGKDADLLENLSRLKSRLRHAFLVYVWDAAHNIEVDQPGRMLALAQSLLERSDAFVVNYA